MKLDIPSQPKISDESCESLLEAMDFIENGKLVTALVPHKLRKTSTIFIVGFLESEFDAPKFYIQDEYGNESSIDWLDLEEQIAAVGNWMWVLNGEA